MAPWHLKKQQKQKISLSFPSSSKAGRKTLIQENPHYTWRKGTSFFLKMKG
jgi:hypothetical protein